MSVGNFPNDFNGRFLRLLDPVICLPDALSFSKDLSARGRAIHKPGFHTSLRIAFLAAAGFRAARKTAAARCSARQGFFFSLRTLEYLGVIPYVLAFQPVEDPVYPGQERFHLPPPPSSESS